VDQEPAPGADETEISARLRTHAVLDEHGK
jgi:hypothetical protein